MFLAKKLSPLLILAGFALVGLFLRRPTGFLAGSLLKKPLEEAFAGSRWGFDLARRHQSDFQPPRRGGWKSHRWRLAKSNPHREPAPGVVAPQRQVLALDGDSIWQGATCETSNRLDEAVGSQTGGALPNRIPIENQQMLLPAAFSAKSRLKSRWAVGGKAQPARNQLKSVTATVF